jgi:putative SOS response-associated peptidase YedK
LELEKAAMCNDYEQHIRWAQYCAMMQAAELGIPTQQSEADLPRADDIKINDTGPVMRAAGNVIELTPMNFSFPPTGRGGPVFNFKLEGRHFDKSNRCLIPASAFFEFTGKKYPKANIGSRSMARRSLRLLESGEKAKAMARRHSRC